MKKSSWIIAGCILSIVFLYNNVSAQQKEENAIKKVIQQETNASFHKNYDGWADTWAHDSADYVLEAGPYGLSELMGWDTISAEYKQNIKNLNARTDAEIAPFLKKTDFHFYINGNMATVTFKEKDQTLNFETRSLVKQNGAWKILNFVLINNSSYAFMNSVNNMKAFIGKWELDGKATLDPSDGAELKSAKFQLKQTPDGLEQLSDFSVIYKNQWYTEPTTSEYFIPDYNTNTISYLVVRKNPEGQTFPQTGTVTSEHPNSFTVTVMDPDKPTAKESEYTVTMQNGKWHQVGKNYGRDGKVIRTETVDLHRIQ